MKNVSFLFGSNNIFYDKKVFFKNIFNKGFYIIDINEDSVSGKEINKIIKSVNSITKHCKNLKMPIRIQLHSASMVDKLTFIILECICYYLIKQGYDVELSWNALPSIKCIITNGVKKSPLLNLMSNCNKSEKIGEFSKRFNFELDEGHFRKIIKNSQNNECGILYQEIECFLRNLGVSQKCSDRVSEMIAELAGNVDEHAHSDCLIDIDVTNSFSKVSETGRGTDNDYFGINIVVLNFSNACIGDGLEKKITLNATLPERYEKAKDAFENHKKMFSSTYCKEDFFNVLAYQHKISGRDGKLKTGGTGLTKVIKSLQSESDMDTCYMLSGERCLIFKEELLNYNEDNWIGFNEEKDFVSCMPREDALYKCNIFFPGTAYNFHFALKRGEFQ